MTYCKFFMDDDYVWADWVVCRSQNGPRIVAKALIPLDVPRLTQPTNQKLNRQQTHTQNKDRVG